MTDGVRPPSRLGLGLALGGAAVALLAGWRIFWFRTDDAYIAFRYASNAMLGHGFVWNAPPFLPVEGYTSPLWVFLLTGVWRATGVEPPDAANPLALLFSAATLAVTAGLALRLPLVSELRRRPVLVLAFVLAGCVTNRTFLAWSSSGLETALFNFLCVAWVATVFRWLSAGGAGRLAATTALASLAALTRPDGLLFLAATGGLAIARERRSPGRLLAATSPALLVAIHLVWRRLAYGAWVPNTYVAKHVSPWPESGLRYLASFVLEYGLLVWLATAVAVLVASCRELRPSAAWVPVGALAAHGAYYTFVIGGDHFEYRVYSAFVPLLYLAFVGMVDRLPVGPRSRLALGALLLAASLPVPWIHWQKTRELATRDATFNLQMPVAPSLPAPVRWYGTVFDRLQAWLADHGVCNRHQEHKVFCETQLAEYPPREVGARIRAEDVPVHAAATVGVAGWTLPEVAVIDRLGLNDRVVARMPPDERGERIMAHDRHPPPFYVESYVPNVTIVDREPRVRRRPAAFDRDYFARAEAHWREWLDSGRSPPSSVEEVVARILVAGP